MKLIENSNWELEVRLHHAQGQILQSQAKFKTVVAGRRFGKSTLMVSAAVYDCLRFKELCPDIDMRMKPVIVLAAPTLPMGRRTLWGPLLDLLRGCPLVEGISQSTFTVSMADGYPDLLLVPIEDKGGDRLRGLRIWRFYGDEIQQIPLEAIDQVVVPAMADTAGSQAVMVGTPNGYSNTLYYLAERAKQFDDWETFKFTTLDNPSVSDEEIRRARRMLSPETFRQEYEASFESPSDLIWPHFSLKKNVIAESPPPLLEHAYYMAYDPGPVNPAMLLACLTAENRIVIIDSFFPGDRRTPVQQSVLKQKAIEWAERHYVVRCFIDPSRPDVVFEFRKAHPRLQGAMSAENAIQPGLARVADYFWSGDLKISTEAGPHMWDFVREIQSYHRDPDRLELPAPGQTDHRVDCLRYLCYSMPPLDEMGNVRDTRFYRQRLYAETAKHPYGPTPELRKKLKECPDI